MSGEGEVFELSLLGWHFLRFESARSEPFGRTPTAFELKYIPVRLRTVHFSEAKG